MVVEKTIEQLYDTEKGMFLADRMVRGTCPHCQANDQPGDNCSVCGETYSPSDSSILLARYQEQPGITVSITPPDREATQFS